MYDWAHMLRIVIKINSKTYCSVIAMPERVIKMDEESRCCVELIHGRLGDPYSQWPCVESCVFFLCIPTNKDFSSSNIVYKFYYMTTSSHVY